MPTPSRIRRSSATMPRQRHYLARLASPRRVDEGFIALGDGKDVDRFVTACRMLRFWKRGEKTKPSTCDSDAYCPEQGTYGSEPRCCASRAANCLPCCAGCRCLASRGGRHRFDVLQGDLLGPAVNSLGTTVRSSQSAQQLRPASSRTRAHCHQRAAFVPDHGDAQGLGAARGDPERDGRSSGTTEIVSCQGTPTTIFRSLRRPFGRPSYLPRRPKRVSRFCRRSCIEKDRVLPRALAMKSRKLPPSMKRCHPASMAGPSASWRISPMLLLNLATRSPYSPAQRARTRAG